MPDFNDRREPRPSVKSRCTLCGNKTASKTHVAQGFPVCKACAEGGTEHHNGDVSKVVADVVRIGQRNNMAPLTKEQMTNVRILG